MPAPTVLQRRSATGCPYGIARYDALECAGANIVEGQAWTQEISPVDPLVRFMELSAAVTCANTIDPTAPNSTSRDISLRLRVSAIPDKKQPNQSVSLEDSVRTINSVSCDEVHIKLE